MLDSARSVAADHLRHVRFRHNAFSRCVFQRQVLQLAELHDTSRMSARGRKTGEVEASSHKVPGGAFVQIGFHGSTVGGCSAIVGVNEPRETPPRE